MSDRRPTQVDDESRLADELASDLERVAAQSRVMPVAGFADRVMASIVREPLPQPARAFRAAVAARRVGAALASIGDAWRVTIGGRVPLAVRGQALALVLVVTAGSLTVAGGATVGAIGLLNANQPPSPSPTAPPPSEPSPSRSPEPSPSPTFTTPELATQPAPTSEATETPDASETPRGAGGHVPATPHPTRSGGGGSGEPTAAPTPTGADDHGRDGSGSSRETPRPSGTDGGGGGD
jgi:hypothetical protein